MPHCIYCNCFFKQITGKHLKQHKTTVKEYIAQHGKNSIYEPDVLERARRGGVLGGGGNNTAVMHNKNIKLLNIKQYDLNPKQCKQCNKNLGYNKRHNTFCNNSCKASYRNANKTFGCNRSKIEEYIEQMLSDIYPDLKIYYNDRTLLTSKELDIYIPELKLAVEINGIFHYRPIFGEEQLRKTQKSDQEKLTECIAANINLYTIDVSKQNKFTPESSNGYLKQITEIIGAVNGSEPHLLSSQDRALR